MEQFQLHELLAQDCIELYELPLSKLLLMNDSQYPWFILVPRVSDVIDTYQLDWQDQQQLLNESSMLSELLMDVFKGEKMNVAALGNVCPQLHIHHIVRYKDDKCWPKPIWGMFPLVPYSEQALTELKQKLVPKIEQILTSA